MALTWTCKSVNFRTTYLFARLTSSKQIEIFKCTFKRKDFCFNFFVSILPSYHYYYNSFQWIISLADITSLGKRSSFNFRYKQAWLIRSYSGLIQSHCMLSVEHVYLCQSSRARKKETIGSLSYDLAEN